MMSLQRQVSIDFCVGFEVLKDDTGGISRAEVEKVIRKVIVEENGEDGAMVVVVKSFTQLECSHIGSSCDGTKATSLAHRCRLDRTALSIIVSCVFILFTGFHTVFRTTTHAAKSITLHDLLTVMEISNEVSLVGTIVASEEDVFNSYNDYAFRLGFNVRKSKQKFKVGSSTKYLKQFYCYKQGKKCEKENGRELKDSGIPIAAGLRALKKQVGGHIEMKVLELKLPQHANRVYTIGAYKLFENQFLKFLEYCQRLVNTLNISCTCKMFIEVCVICSYCSRAFNFHCVQAILDKYIPKSQTKDIALSPHSSGVGDAEKVNKMEIAGSKNEGRSSNIKDPVGRCTKGEYNVRKRSMEINRNQTKSKRKSALTHTSRIKTVVQLSMNDEALGKKL
ncbi:hypothetical protein M9H77_35573 [Catharanthus roseus]|uniref:Uncharacterized protein n=1 Tax=Catharanthus roseus TaxID=4058 RepID=A0ACB9ZRA0_CATRO|nr:hypothetical protein M9H77_35573 [Catharanthus roseus]